MKTTDNTTGHTSIRRILMLTALPATTLTILYLFSFNIFKIISLAFTIPIQIFIGMGKTSFNILFVKPMSESLETSIGKPANTLVNFIQTSASLTTIDIVIISILSIALILTFIFHFEEPFDNTGSAGYTLNDYEPHSINFSLSKLKEYLENDYRTLKSNKKDLEEKLFVVRNAIWNQRYDRVEFNSSKESDYESRLDYKNGYLRVTKDVSLITIGMFSITLFSYVLNFLFYNPDGSAPSYFIFNIFSSFFSFISALCVVIFMNVYVHERKRLKSTDLETFISDEYKLYADTIKELQAKASGIRAKLKANDEVMSKLKAEIIKRNDALLND